MERMAFSAVVRERGAELTSLYLSEVEIVDGCVSRVVETFVIDMVLLAYGRHMGTIVKLTAVQLVSEIAGKAIFDQGAEEAEVEAMDLDIRAATTTLILPDGTIWFTDTEEGQDVLVHSQSRSPTSPLRVGNLPIDIVRSL